MAPKLAGEPDAPTMVTGVLHEPVDMKLVWLLENDDHLFRTFFPAITLATGERRQEIRYPSRPMATRPTEVAPRRRQAPKPAAPVVEFKDVTKVYDGGAVGLDRASLRIGRGEFVFLVGADRAAASPPASACC